MVDPYGAEALAPLFVAPPIERSQLLARASGLPSLQVSTAAAATALLLGAGHYTPRPGFMDRSEAARVAADMDASGGQRWPVPLLNLVREWVVPASLRPGGRIALLDPQVDGNPVLAIQTVTAIEPMSAAERVALARQVYGSESPDHPGVAALLHDGEVLLAGPVRVLGHSYCRSEFGEVFRTAGETRAQIQERGWQRVLAVPVSRELDDGELARCRQARTAAQAEGVLFHVPLGRVGAGGQPAAARIAAAQQAVAALGWSETAMVAAYAAERPDAGTRQVLADAIVHQNCGCTHMLVNRDPVDSPAPPTVVLADLHAFSPDHLRIELVL